MLGLPTALIERQQQCLCRSWDIERSILSSEITFARCRTCGLDWGEKTVVIDVPFRERGSKDWRYP